MSPDRIPFQQIRSPDKEKLENKKIILTGPPGVGKTTLKLAFFERVNPMNLLRPDNPILEPTRGAEIGKYQLFNSEIGLFDLAGQENSRWLDDGKEIFVNADIIIVMFDVENKLKEIVQFLFSILSIRQKICKHAKMYVIFHKIDLISRYELYKRIDYIRKFLRDKSELKPDYEILKTSIKEEYFLQSYQVIQKIILDAFDRDLIVIPRSEYQQLNLFVKIVLFYEPNVSYYLNDLIEKFNLKDQNLDELVEKLKYMKLIELSGDPNGQFGQKFMLSEHAEFFKLSIRKIQTKIADLTKKTQSSESEDLYEEFQSIMDYKQQSKIKSENSAYDLVESMKSAKDKVAVSDDESLKMPLISPEVLFHFLSNIKKQDSD